MCVCGITNSHVIRRGFFCQAVGLRASPCAFKDLRYRICQDRYWQAEVRDFPLAENPLSFFTMPFSIAPLLRYFLMRSISLLSLISSRSIFISNSWLSVSKYLDKSRHIAYLYPSSAYSFTFGMASFALLCGLQP